MEGDLEIFASSLQYNTRIQRGSRFKSLAKREKPEEDNFIDKLSPIKDTFDNTIPQFSLKDDPLSKWENFGFFKMANKTKSGKKSRNSSSENLR